MIELYEQSALVRGHATQPATEVRNERLSIPSHFVISVCGASTSSELVLATLRERQHGCSHCCRRARSASPASPAIHFAR